MSPTDKDFFYMRPMVASLPGKVCLFMLSATGGISQKPNLSGFGIHDDNRRRIVLMVAMGAGVRSHSGMTICDKPEKGDLPRLLCRPGICRTCRILQQFAAKFFDRGFLWKSAR